MAVRRWVGFGLTVTAALALRLYQATVAILPRHHARQPICDSAVAVRILVTSEQHLQRVGSDRRLLALLHSLRSLHAQVSMLVRTRKCGSCTHSPSIPELCRLLGSATHEAVPLVDNGKPVPPGPALYEYGGTRSFASLLHAAAFDLLLVGLWFWYDPQPSFAELLLPVARANGGSSEDGGGGVDGELQGGEVEGGGARRRRSTRARSPLIALLSDDAHAERARRLAVEETHNGRGRGYRTQVRAPYERHTNAIRMPSERHLVAVRFGRLLWVSVICRLTVTFTRGRVLPTRRRVTLGRGSAHCTQRQTRFTT